MKRLQKQVIVLTILLLAFFGCKDVAVTGIALNKDLLTLEIGETERLVATVLPENATTQTIVWTSTDMLVAAITQAGTVSALTQGETTIVATTVDGNFTASSKVNVKDYDPIKKLKTKAVDTLVLGDNSFVLDAEFWYDSSLQNIPVEKLLHSRNWLICTNFVKIPNHIDMVKQYVFYKDLIWIADYEDKPSPSLPPSKMEKESKNGPLWITSIDDIIYFDVISHIHDAKSNRDYYLWKKNVLVQIIKK